MKDPICCMPTPSGKHLKWGWMNVYRSGWFHREGKPNTFDRHAGDIYDSRAEALKNIEPQSHYIDTVAFGWMDVEDVKVNPPESEPIGLAITRQAHRDQYAALAEEVAHG